MLSRHRRAIGALLFLLVASCSGGGCSGCGTCAGMTPLPGGFPSDKAVENAASVRVSRPGLDFVEAELGMIAAKAMNAPNGTLSLEIPESPFEVKDAFCIGVTIGGNCIGFEPDVSGAICPGGADKNESPPRCVAAVGLDKARFALDAIKPNALAVDAVVPLRLDDTPVSITAPVRATIHVAYGANGRCEGERPVVDVKQLPIKVTVPVAAESTAPRTGYSKVDVDGANVDLEAIKSEDVRLCGSCGALPDNWCASLLNWGFIKDRIVGQLKSSLAGQVKNVLRDQLCTKPNPTLAPPCPTDTAPDAAGKYCVYDADKAKCVPSLLGTDAHVDLGGFLRTFSPSTTGGLDFGLASFGAMKPAPGLERDPAGRTRNGVTLGMIGGVLPQPPSKCVVQKPVVPPAGIAIPDELAPTTPEAAGAPHVGIALAGRFLDYSFTSLYNSGLLCLGVSTEQFDLLKSGLLAFLIPSLKTLTFEQSDAAAAIVTRPQEAPVVKIGGGTDPNTDPLLAITLPRFSLDFYVWSFDRFARVFTYTGDLAIPVTLQTGKGPSNPNGGIVPALGDIKVTNGAVTNADVLLLDNPDVVAGAVSGIFGTISKQIVGNGFAPIDLSGALASFGLNLEIGGIKRLTKGADDYVGIFATMGKRPPAATAEAETGARLVGKRVWRDNLQAATYDPEKLPELEVDVTSAVAGATRPLEYTWWIDGGTRAPWRRLDTPAGTRLVIKDDQLFLQGRHVLHVTTRIVDDAATEDTTPADVPYVVDALAPFVRTDLDGSGAVAIRAWDLVSAPSALVGRFRFDDGDFTAWGPTAELAHVAAGGATTLEVEVRDEEGNVATLRQELRGRADPTLVATGSGCGCSTPGTPGGLPSGRGALAAGLFAAAVVGLRRRKGARSAAALGLAGALVATTPGCGSDTAPPRSGCGSDCNQACTTGLGRGQPGAYLSIAKSKDGSIWAAGYNDAFLSEGDTFLWGDLVVGKYDLGRETVDWEVVDGVPTRTDGTCPQFERGGFRNGETEAGDNVGRYTSLQMSTSDQAMVSYYDDTNHRLKFAIDDRGWKVAVLREQPGADIGRSSKMVLVGGKPVIAYLHLEPGNAGRTRAKVVLARAKNESPHGAEDFTFEDVAVDEDAPCRATSCAEGTACIRETGTCTTPIDGCVPACSDTSACVAKDGKATCLAKPSPIETYPRALGAFLSLAEGPRGLGIALYDGHHGNLVALLDRGRTPWERVVLDGEAGKREDRTAIDTGDVGIASSLAIGPDGTWHVAYVSGLDESLRYVTMDPDGKPGRPEVVDDGTTLDGKAHADGSIHIVGDDAAIRLDGDIVTLAYADSTSLGVRRAVGRRGGGARREWSLGAVKQEPGRWLAFPRFVPGDGRVAVWWRQGDRSRKAVTGDVIVIAP